MNRIYIIILLIIISCNKNNDSTKKSPIDTVILISNNKNTINEIINTSVDDKLIETLELPGIWEFETAVLADNNDIPDNEKILIVKDQIIEIYNEQLIVRNLCKSKIIVRKKSSIDYWGSEKTLSYQRTAFKNAGLNLSDSILVIENSNIDSGCELPFSELLFVDNKIISTMYPYIILFKKNNQQCFLPIEDLELPIDSKQIKNIKARHELLCELNSLEKFRCGSEAITYYTIPPKKNFVFAIFPQNCGDSEFNTLVVLKNNKIIDELIIDKISETEVDGERALNYTECQIDNNYNIHLTHSTWIEGKSNKQNFKDVNLFINDEGKFIKK